MLSTTTLDRLRSFNVPGFVDALLTQALIVNDF